VWIGLLIVASGIALGAESTLGGAAPESELPSVGPSLARVLGAFAFVLMLFFGGVWVARNWQRLVPRASGPADLQVLEVKSLGARQNLVVVGYRGQRMLLAAAPTGVTLLTHLPEPDPTEATVPTTVIPAGARVSRTDFIGAFREVLARRA
jgi:flagellar biogenesis protein FliO